MKKNNRPAPWYHYSKRYRNGKLVEIELTRDESGRRHMAPTVKLTGECSEATAKVICEAPVMHMLLEQYVTTQKKARNQQHFKEMLVNKNWMKNVENVLKTIIPTEAI